MSYPVLSGYKSHLSQAEAKIQDYLDNWAGIAGYSMQENNEFPERESEDVHHLFRLRQADSLTLHNWVAIAGYEGRQIGGKHHLNGALDAKAYYFLSLHKRSIVHEDYYDQTCNGVRRRVDVKVKSFVYKWLLMDQKLRTCYLTIVEDLSFLPHTSLQARISYNGGKIDDLYLPGFFLYAKIFPNHLQDVINRDPRFLERRAEIPRQFERYL